MCRDVRVMCVTYESNDMKAGDPVIFKGGYNRLDDNHIMSTPAWRAAAHSPHCAERKAGSKMQPRLCSTQTG